MDITNAIKHAPKWSYYAGGGVIVGVVSLRLWKHRTTSTGETPAAGSDSGGLSDLGAPSVAGTGGSGPGYVIPPVIAPSAPVDQSGTGLTELQQLYFTGVEDLLHTVPDVYQQVWGPIQQNDQALVNAAISSIANGGSAPQPVQQNPTPVAVAQPAAPAAPAATPVTAAPPAPAPAPADPCPGGEFPFSGPHGCYKVVCASGKGDHAKGRWHFYKSGLEEHVSNSC
jgi:hypothetical protein